MSVLPFWIQSIQSPAGSHIIPTLAISSMTTATAVLATTSQEKTVCASLKQWPAAHMKLPFTESIQSRTVTVDCHW